MQLSNNAPPCDPAASERRYPMPFTRLEIVVLSVIEGTLQVLLARRAEAPQAGKWGLPGGVLRIDLDTSLEDAAKRVMQERLGLELPFLRQLYAVGGPTRDPRAPWALSVVYRALVPSDACSPQPGKRTAALEWRPADEASTNKALAFDHAAMISAAVECTRTEVEHMELPMGYLPEQFTLGELQTACEAILGRPLDKSSFRRKLADREMVEPVEGVVRTGANRPAQVFRLVDP